MTPSIMVLVQLSLLCTIPEVSAATSLRHQAHMDMKHKHESMMGNTFAGIVANAADPMCKTGLLSWDRKVCCSGFCGECSDYPSCKNVRGQASTNTCCKSAVADRECGGGKAPANDCVQVCSNSLPPCITDLEIKIPTVKRHAKDDCNHAIEDWRQKAQEAISGTTPHCTGTFSISSDNAYALYISGQYRSNVNGGRTNIDCPTPNPSGDPYTGMNWQSVDLHHINVQDEAVTIGVDAIDCGGVGGLIGTAVINGVEYPTDASGSWKCIRSDGSPPPAGWADHDFDASAWVTPTSFGQNGVKPWGDVNREMGKVDDGGHGTISAASEWIWTGDQKGHNDIYCRLVVPCH